MQSSPPGQGAEMSFIEHLDELRVRLMRSMLVFILLMLVCYAFRVEILDLIKSPVEEPLKKYSALAPPPEAPGKPPLPMDISSLDCRCLPAPEQSQISAAQPAAEPTLEIASPVPLATAPGTNATPVDQDPSKSFLTQAYDDFYALYLSLTGREEEAARLRYGEPAPAPAFTGEVLRLECACSPKDSSPGHMVYIGLPELFFAQMKASIYAALFFCFPFFVIELWGFVGPALYHSERKIFWWFALSSYVFFTGGSLFGYFVVFPYGFDFFLSLTQPGEIMPSLSVGEYLDFTLKMFLAFGLIFELPLVVFILSRIGWVTPKLMIQHGRLAIVVIFIVAGVLTPPDPFTMFLMAGPLLALYVFSIGVSYMAQNKRAAALREQGLDPFDTEG